MGASLEVSVNGLSPDGPRLRLIPSVSDGRRRRQASLEVSVRDGESLLVGGVLTPPVLDSLPSAVSRRLPSLSPDEEALLELNVRIR